MYDQHKYKAASTQCEIAWYLDRQIRQATTLQDVLEKAKTGKYPYYLIPYVPQTAPIIQELRNKFESEFIQGQARISNKYGFTYKGGMMSYFLFNLNKPIN